MIIIGDIYNTRLNTDKELYIDGYKANYVRVSEF
jgi:hypothetical protein